MALLSGQLGAGRFRNERRIFKFPGSHSWTVPSGVTQVFAFVIGAGGGGTNGNDGAQSGGAGGGYAHGVISGLTPGATVTCTVGQGGNGSGNAPSTSYTSGTASSFGSYLTGNGGERGQISMSVSDSSTSEGGTASTSGVSEAFTATGGHGGINGSSSTNSPHGFGGGASGSPFGTPKGFKSQDTTHPYKPIVTGGMGWHGTEKRVYIPQRGSVPICVMGACGMGGHGDMQLYNSYYDGLTTYNTEGPKGGPGMRGAKGGRGCISAGDCITYGHWGYGSNHTYSTQQRVFQPSSVAAGPQAGGQAEHGESFDWWFPWEMDGGGGGGFSGGPANNNSYRTYPMTAGHGGNGSGGGPMNAMARLAAGTGSTIQWNTNTFEWSACAGNGGFGGGGGGAFSSINNSYFHLNGGDGGVGGGGGSTCFYPSSRRYRAGNGGDGIVVIYW